MSKILILMLTNGKITLIKAIRVYDKLTCVPRIIDDTLLTILIGDQCFIQMFLHDTRCLNFLTVPSF